MEAACRLVAAVLELSARVQHGEDHLERALLRRRMLVDRDAAAVVGDGDRAAVLVEGDDDVRGKAVHGLVYGVVENLPDQMMEAGGADAADIHARPLADRLEPFENGDVFGGVVGHWEDRLPEAIEADLKVGLYRIIPCAYSWTSPWALGLGPWAFSVPALHGAR